MPGFASSANLRIADSEEFKQEARKISHNTPPAGVEWTQKVLIGAVHHEIVDAAKTEGVDLIVMGAANPRVTDYLLGTTASHVVTHAECSVYVVR